MTADVYSSNGGNMYYVLSELIKLSVRHTAYSWYCVVHTTTSWMHYAAEFVNLQCSDILISFQITTTSV